MAKLESVRVAEMLNDLDDFETEFNDFETKFLDSIRTNLERYEDKFKFFGNQQVTFEKIYDKYVKEVQN
jgi:hypothetical protein